MTVIGTDIGKRVRLKRDPNKQTSVSSKVNASAAKGGWRWCRQAAADSCNPGFHREGPSEQGGGGKRRETGGARTHVDRRQTETGLQREREKRQQRAVIVLLQRRRVSTEAETTSVCLRFTRGSSR